ncbi:transcriptional regulator [Phormidium sp. CCY1219]|jgi:predicted transcriptional regulator|uniref:transcriptional regulator n=1 Tax=Phormidium sp. CCY1219 TaxID=2886104 RepID=UPI002D1F0DA6|nr:transcriptional regulator [Phormidium sp. CCY1219]MEB3827334.1 transcriptional regulator [Phormidium sp. CCY1219]
MKLDPDLLTRYLHRLRNQSEWMTLNEVGETLKMDRATSRRYTKLAMEWGLVERQQQENQPTLVRATEKLVELDPSEVRSVVNTHCAK